MIIASAGHVDHGKTTLVQALTGVNTDRLAEEQRRGMTIEPGFAYAYWDSGGQPLAMPVGIVDVPGHERFVRNMLAGVAGVDLGLLVVAADDGPMPQTREHLAILGLLGVPQLVVALSKIDRVPAQRLAQAHREIDALLADGPYAGSPRFAVAANMGTGVEALRLHLADAAHKLAQGPATGHFRMVVDRSFSIAGAGRIVTGVVLSGQVMTGDEVVVSPAGTAVRVRGLHAQNQPAALARAGQRCALNLAGPELKRAEPQRGDWVLHAAAHAPTQRLDVHLQVLSSELGPLRTRSALQLHLGAAVVNAHVLPLGGNSLAPGSTGLAQLVLDLPVAAAHADRFILREPAANRTVAGGWVVDPFGPQRGHSLPLRLAHLQTQMQPDAAKALAAATTLDPNGVDLQAFARSRNLRADETERLCHQIALQVLPARGGAIGLAAAHWQTWRDRMLAALDDWHRQFPDSRGPQGAELNRQLGLTNPASHRPSAGRPAEQAVSKAVSNAVLAALIAEGLIAQDGLRHHRPSHRPVISPADSEWLRRISAQLLPAGLRPPIVGELAAQLVLPVADMLAHLARLAANGHLVRVAPNRFYLPGTVVLLVAEARKLAGESEDGCLDAASYRDRTGIGRNLTVQVLEFMRREGLTRFDGKRHQLLS